jgi:hypothetical protein
MITTINLDGTSNTIRAKFRHEDQPSLVTLGKEVFGLYIPVDDPTALQKAIEIAKDVKGEQDVN